jgi:hypothetical protein
MRTAFLLFFLLAVPAIASPGFWKSLLKSIRISVSSETNGIGKQNLLWIQIHGHAEW